MIMQCPPWVILNHGALSLMYAVEKETLSAALVSHAHRGDCVPTPRSCHPLVNFGLSSCLLPRMTSYLPAPLPGECLPILKALMSRTSSEEPPPTSRPIITSSLQSPSLFFAKIDKKINNAFLTNDTTLSI